MSLRLEDLVEAARATSRRRKGRVSEASLRRDAEELGRRSPAGRLAAALAVPGVSAIAEVKGASPLSGSLREDFVPVELATAYADNGAAAVSVLTEEHFFAGSLEHLSAVSSSIELPTLRKDFVSELYQVFDAAMAGAGAVLLIAEVLDAVALKEFVEAAHSVGLDALVEFHRPALLVPAVEAGSGIIGINNRNLDTLEIDPEHALALAHQLPAEVLTVAESAISSPGDVERVARSGFDAMLVGTALVTADDPGAMLAELVAAGARSTGRGSSSRRGDAGAAGGGDRSPEAGNGPDDLDLPDDIDLSGAVLL